MAIKKCWAIFHIDPVVVQSSNIGYSFVGKKGVDQFYFDEQYAMDVANEIAAKHPGTQVVILEAKHIIEAKIPETVAKRWQDNGELIPIERSLKEKKLKIRIDEMDAVAQQLHDLARNRPRLRPQVEVPEIRVNYDQQINVNGQAPNPNPPFDPERF
jgi:hypothetical protein